MNRNAQVMLFVAWTIVGSVLITNEYNIWSYIGWFFLGGGLIAITYTLFFKRKESKEAS